MIFTTIKDSTTQMNESIGLFGHSIKEIKDTIYDIQTLGFKKALLEVPTYDISAIQKYNDAIEAGFTIEKSRSLAIKGTNDATKELIINSDGAIQITEELTSASKASTVAAKAQSLAYGAVSMAANMLISALVVKGIELAANAIDHYVNRAKYAAEAMEEAQQKIDDANSSLKKLSSTLNENKDRFLELSTGVNEFSKNVSLSEDDYQEYLSISQEFAELSPSLVSGYDDQGNALLNIGKNAEETAAKLNEVLETQQNIAKQTLVDNLDKVAKGIYSEVDTNKGKITQLKQELADAEQEFNQLNYDIADIAKNGNGIFTFNDVNDPLRTYRNNFIKALEDAKITWEDMGNDQIRIAGYEHATNNGGQNAYQIRDIALKEAQEYYNSLQLMDNNLHAANIAGLKKEIAEKEKEINNSYSKMSANLQAWVEQNYSYQYLSDDSQNLVNTLIPKIDWNDLDIDLLSGSDYQDYITKNILNPLMSIPKEHKKEIDDAFSKLLSFEDGDINILPLAKQLQDKLKELGITIDLTPIIGNEEEAKRSLQNSLRSITDDHGISNRDDYSKLEEYTKDFNVEQIETWKSVTLGIKDADKAIQAYEEHLKQVAEESQSLSFTDSISQVQALSAGFDQLDKIYADVLNKEDFDWSSILNNTSFSEAFGSMENVTDEYKSAYDDFIKIISNNPDDMDKCQEAFNNLATAYVQNSGALKNLTEENKQAITTMLEQMGVSNAEEVVNSTLIYQQKELAAQKTVLANTTSDLTNVTASEITNLQTEGIVSEESAQEILLFAMQKQVANLTTISTADDIGNLSSLCVALTATGVECTKLKQLIDLLNDDSTIMSNERRQTIINRVQKEMEEIMAGKGLEIKLPTIDYTGGDKTKSSADSAKKTADDLYNDLKEQIDAYMDYMEKSLDAGKIDYNTYCSSVKNYLDDLYNSGKLKAKDYFDYTEKMLNKQKDIYDKVISAVVNRLEEEADKWQEKIDELESANDKLNDNLSNMDSALDAIDRVYDNEIDRIQAIIDGLEDANDKRNKALALEKAKYELEKAYNSKVKKLYVEGRGYVYDVDYDAIKDAQSSYDDAELDVKTDELRKQIDTLTNFKAKWDDVKNAYQYNIDEMNAAALLGSEYQKLILNNNILDVENFKNQYVGIQQQINSNEELIKSYNEKVNYYNKLKEQWQSITDEYNTQMNAQYASQVLGANWENDVLNGRLSTLDGFRTQYISVQQAIADAQWQSANEQIKALQALANAAWASANEQINAAKEAQKAASGSTGSAGSVGSAYNVSGMISAGAPTSVINKITGKKSNTSAAATADQRKNNSNIIMSNEQKKTIAASKKRANNIRKYANGGVVKINPDDLLADLAKQHGEDGFVMARNGERVLTPNQNASFEKFVDLITGMNITPQMLMPDFTRFATGNSTDNSSVIVNIGDINLQGVQNAEQLGDAIIKRLPGYITQKFNNKQR